MSRRCPAPRKLSAQTLYIASVPDGRAANQPLAAETLIPAERGAARGQSGFDRLASSVARIWSAKTSRSAPICCGVAGASIRSYQDSPNARVSVLPTPAVIEQIGDRGGEIMIWASSGSVRSEEHT